MSYPINAYLLFSADVPALFPPPLLSSGQFMRFNNVSVDGQSLIVAVGLHNRVLRSFRLLIHNFRCEGMFQSVGVFDMVYTGVP